MDATPSRIEKYTWDLLEDDCQAIAFWARDKDIKNIHGVPRGGLAMAVKLSHLLDKPLIPNRADITEETLVVDDIVDGGDTLERLFASSNVRPHVATIYFNKTAKVVPDYYVREKTAWVLFPWETVHTSKRDHTV